ncbi:enoyl-CoA hydratase [Sulfitobacter sp. BDSS02]|nr:enoyl-CoA hydratase [Sulfitobacter sp. BDSS02]MBR9849408.1 enoyl-CoA hydratase [Paracoccaceae bacterium]
MAILERNDIDAVAHLRMNAPERLNALSDEMLAALQDTLDELREDNSIRAVILSGAGKAFCAGHDLKEMTAGRQSEDGGAAYFQDLFERCSRVMQTIPTLPQPVIAQVHGIATAAGCQLVATCDMAIAAQDTKFGVNGVNIGLFCSTPMVALSRNISRKKAFEMLSTGTFLDADAAESAGLINRSVPVDRLADVTDELAGIIASKLGTAVKIGKRAFYEQIQMPVSQAYEFTGNVMVENMLNPETEQGIAAFLEKRPPSWNQ